MFDKIDSTIKYTERDFIRKINGNLFQLQNKLDFIRKTKLHKTNWPQFYCHPMKRNNLFLIHWSIKLTIKANLMHYLI